MTVSEEVLSEEVEQSLDIILTRRNYPTMKIMERLVDKIDESDAGLHLDMISYILTHGKVFTSNDIWDKHYKPYQFLLERLNSEHKFFFQKDISEKIKKGAVLKDVAELVLFYVRKHSSSLSYELRIAIFYYILTSNFYFNTVVDDMADWAEECEFIAAYIHE